MKRKILFCLIIFLLFSTVADAIRINNNGSNVTRFKPSGTDGWITLANGSFSYLNISSTYLSINSTYKFNSSANTTISNITHANDKLNFTASATSGTLNLLLVMSNNSYSYVLLIDNVFSQRTVSNSTGYVIFNYSGWSQHNFYVRGNSAPVITDVTLSPSNATITSNLTVSTNATDENGDPLTYYYRWYKNGVLNTSWNDSTYVNYTNNFTTDDSIYVKGYVSDSYENSSEMQSNTVLIGSGNSAPTLPGITLNPSTKKYNKSIYVNTTANITDTESSEVRLQVYWYNASVKTWLGNSSWFVPPNNASVNITIPWSDGLTHTIYAQAEDSGNALGQNNLTSGEATATFTSNITVPNVTSSSISATSITVGNYVTITAIMDGIGANISSASVQVERPDATTASWAMTCTVSDSDSENSTCTKTYTSTSDVGTYYVRFINVTDDSDNTGSYSSPLVFNANAATTSTSSGGGGGAGGYIVPTPTPEQANISILPPLLKFVNVTDVRGAEELEAIGKCLSESLLLSSSCSGGSISIVTNPVNWWTLVGAYLFSVLTLFFVSIVEDRKKALRDFLLYGTITVAIVEGLTLVGFNMFVINYAAQSSLPFYMFLSFATWGMFITVIGDDYFTPKSKKRMNGYFGGFIGHDFERAKREWNASLVKPFKDSVWNPVTKKFEWVEKWR